MGSVAIQCIGLRKTYPAKPPVEAVRGLDLTIQTGECFGLLGPNGAGKTTTIEILEGLLEPSSGEVEVLGRRWKTDGPAIRERIGISLQETKLSDKLTVGETVRLFRSFYHEGISPDEAIQAVSLQEKTNTWVNKLSGGQKQRLAVACAIVGKPELLFLDEPTTGLDPQSRRQLWEIIQGYKDQGRTILLTTHYMDEAEKLCDRVGVVDAGKLIALGPPRQLIDELGGGHVVEFEMDSHQDQDIEQVRQLPATTEVRREGQRYTMVVQEVHTALPALLHWAAQSQRKLTSLTTHTATLEDVFVKLTGRHLRDEGANS
ncbi:MAG: ABC transporter ATP-binding protein [Gemmatales bacterium]